MKTATTRALLHTISIFAALAPAAPALQDASAPEEVELTLGADGETLVREVRSAQLLAGDARLRVFDVSPMLLPESLHLRALTGPENLELKEQSAWFEVLDGARALERLASRPVHLERFHAQETEKLEGRLLFPPVVPGPKGEVKLPLYLEQPDGLIRLLDQAEVELDALPEGDWNRFRLDWRLACKRAERYRFELLYVTRGLQWHADYVVRVAADGASADLGCVATVENGTGVTFRGAKLQFAGAPELVPWHRRADPAERADARLYPATDPATIEARRNLQVALAVAHELPARSVPTLFVPRPPRETNGTFPVVRRVEVENAAARGMGRALPGGRARVYVVDSKNRPFLAATSEIAAIAANAPLAFAGEPLPGLVAEVSSRPITQGHGGVRIAALIRSERDDKLDVEVLCPIGACETIEDSTLPADRGKPSRATFVMPVPARGALTLEFTLAKVQ